ncbi:glycoside hydrolase family 64 protein [Streptomyces sp. NPDC090021]|uniref:glycoside hydrolase family 64 protein n=1 Tax=Streptomyces sp. NPDC090021 TaxID=3365919 RepID=UPI00382F0CD1
MFPNSVRPAAATRKSVIGALVALGTAGGLLASVPAHASATEAAPAAWAGVHTAVAPDASYKQSLYKGADGKARFVFTPTDKEATTLVDVHYTVKGAPEGQQSLRMQRQGDGSWVLSGPRADADFTYHYTFGDTRLVRDTAVFGKDGKPVTGDPTTPPSADPTEKTFPLRVVNETGKPSEEVYLTVIGQMTPGHYSYMEADGTMRPVHPADVNSSDVYRKDGRAYPRMSFKLSEAAKDLRLPEHLEGGRIYMSLGHPMYMDATDGDKGYQQPDPGNPSDPNHETKWDFYEYTYQHGKVSFGGDTTQVDGFAIPMTAQLVQESSKYDKMVGIKASAESVVAGYKATVGDAFKGLAGKDRITAPRTSAEFKPGGKYADYFARTVTTAWDAWKAGFELKPAPGIEFKGKVETDGKLHFTKNGGAPNVLDKPSTADIMACDGALANAGMTQDAKDLGAQVCAAFNRGVALNTKDGGTLYDWSDPAKYYPKGGTYNDYAAYFHDRKVSVDGLAYAFAYDDVHDQSSVAILPNNDAPTSLTLTLH